MALIETAMTALDTAGTGFVKTAYTTLSATVLPTAKIFFGLSIAWYGLQGMLGMSQFTLDTIFKRLGVIALITVGLSGWPFFETFFYDIVIKTPEQIGNALFKGFVGGKVASSTAGLQVAWDTGFEAVQAAFAQGGISSLGAYLAGILIAFAVIFFTVLAFVIIAFGKMFAYVLLSIAPLFIILLAFQWTRNWFISYINALFHIIILLIVSYAVVGFMLGMSFGAVQTLQSDAKSMTASFVSIAPYIFYMILGGICFTRVPSLAAMLAGGISMNVGEMRAFSFTTGTAAKAGMYSADALRSGFMRTKAFGANRSSPTSQSPTLSSPSPSPPNSTASTPVGRGIGEAVSASRTA